MFNLLQWAGLEAERPSAAPAWPKGLEPVEVREHPAARRVVLRIRPDGGLALSVPRRFSAARLPAILESKRSWIERTRRRLAAKAPSLERPARLDLAAFGLSYPLSFATAARASARETPQGPLTVCGPGAAGQALALKRFVARRCRPLFEARVQERSRAMDLPYRSLGLNWARSRWGSCAGRADIRLSLRLAFVPESLLDYVIVHELCHTRWGGHGPRFWGLVERHLPDARERRRALNRGGQWVPAWLEMPIEHPGAGG